MADSQQQEVQHFLDYWRVIQSRKEIVIAVSLFVILTGVVITLSLPRVYMASTRIGVRQDAPEMILQRGQLSPVTLGTGYDPYFLRTQFEVIQSKPIIYEAIQNLRLREHFGRMYSDDGSPLSLSDAYKQVVRGMRVQQYRDTNLIEIRIQRSTRRSTPDVARQDASRIANEIASVYRDYRMKISREEKERGLQATEQAYKAEQKKVDELETQLEKLRQDLKITMLSGSEMAVATSLDSAKLERLEINRIGARKEMLDRKTRLEAIEKLQGDELLYSAALLVGDAALTALRQELIQAEAKLKQLQETLGAKHPDVVQLTSVVDDLKKKIGDALQGIKLGLQTDYAIALKAYEEADADLVKAREDDIKLHGEAYLPFRKQESLLARQRELRNALENRLMQERLDLDQPRRPVEVVDPAEAPAADEPVSPKMALNIVLSVIVGLGCGIGLVFFVEYMDTSVKTVEDIERYIGASIMGVIPQKVRPLLDEGADSAHAESYRVLRMNVQFSKKLGNGNTLCVTSGGAGEGKSLTLFNLAYVSAQLGDRVLLVDSDMRRPTQHKMFKAPNRLGLADLLVGKASVDEVIKTSSVPNLDFLPSGKLPSSAHGVLSAARLRALIDELKTRYDYVFFDAPPIMGVSDAAIISSEVDGVLLVVQHRSYPRAVSLRAKNMVDNVGGNLIGVVLNNINVTRDYYYYYYHSYYYTYRDKESRAERKGAAAKAAAEPAAPVPPQKA